MTEPSHAVFLSYASEDQAAAQRICDALRAGGIEVWFDQSALRGGDAWDQAIRKQIKTCVLFIPVISRHTHDRDEGYFRLEWKLAVDRSHLMTSNRAFLLPVVIDETREDDENVPDRFKDIHWTRLPAGETPAAFVERVRRLVAPEPSRPTTVSPAAPAAAVAPPVTERLIARPPSKRALQGLAALAVIGALAYFAIDKFWVHKQPPPTPPAVSASAGPARFSPPPHSIAVLPFVNMSGDPKQEYFSDGLTEELLNSLARINELQVAARTSAFAFKGKDTDIGTIARKLNVGAILEGSVRQAGHKIRITAQLNNAVTGFHLWSQTYDRDLSDVLTLQTEIANAVAGALKVTLLGDVAAKIEAAGTRNPAAFDAYLRASKTYWEYQDDKDLNVAIAGYTDAIRLDPEYALAYADRAVAFNVIAGEWATSRRDRKDYFNKAEADARRAIELQPNLALGHVALAMFFAGAQDYMRESQEIERALALEPGNARILRDYGTFAANMGRTDVGIAAVRRAVALDPLNAENHERLGAALLDALRPQEAVDAYKNAVALSPSDPDRTSWLGLSYYLSRDFQAARATCESVQPANYPTRLACLAVTYKKLGRLADAEAAFTQLRELGGDRGAVTYAMIYTEWGQSADALEWLETAGRQQNPDLSAVKANHVFDPLRKEPRFQAIEQALKFPN